MLNKRLTVLLITVFCMMACMSGPVLALDADVETLTIKGDGVTRTITIDRAELEAMSQGIKNEVYSASNNFPSDKVMYRQGVSLAYLLQQAGIKDTARQLKFIASDGYARNFTLKELLKDERFYFKSDGSKVKVPAIIAFADSAKGFDSMNEIELSLTMGQRVKGEQNNPWFVKYLQTIEVSTAEPEQWPQVTFSKSSGPDGATYLLKHNNFDAVKIYYTTDGTDPGINSKMYNIGASYYQPALNKPVIVPWNAEIRAVAIGPGKIDSVVSSSKDMNETPGVFTDLGGYDWARPAIEELNQKGIISGIGPSLFAPGKALTRAQFATLIVLARGEQPGTGTAAPFSDVKTGDWFCAYVEKAVSLGWLKGYEDGTFRPDQVLRREEMLTILVQARGIDVNTAGPTAASLAAFSAETRISNWARPYVAKAEDLGMLEHGHMAFETDQGLSLDAQGPTSRAEAAVCLYRMLQL